MQKEEVKAVIRVTGLCKKYGTYTALDHLDFTIEKGKIYGFLGPNGAGKSTTMNILTGYLQATAGTVLIDGIDIRKKPEQAKAKIGYLPENPPLYQDMTVQEYLEFAAGLKKISKARRKSAIVEVMELTDIRDYRNVLIKKLSKGYKQRVGMAQAMLGYPPVIILDEPTVGLDPKQITQMRGLIRRLGKKHTVILSSHILSEIQAVCDEVLIISEGRIVAQDTPKHLEEEADMTQKISLLVKATAEQAEELIKQVENVDMISLVEEAQKGRLRYEVVAKSGYDIREDLSCLMAENRIPVLEMTESKVSLEDIFLQLTAPRGDDSLPVAQENDESEHTEKEQEEA